MNTLKVITLQNNKIKLDLLPEIGGRISSLICDDFHVLRPIPLHDIKSLYLYKGGSFPLVPFSNRIKNAKFKFNELEYNLTQNAFPHAIHGHGYLSEWRILEQTNEPVSHPTDGFNLMQLKKENSDSWFLAPNENINGLIELDLEK